MNTTSVKHYQRKQLLSYIRQGDFAHAGEVEAIELVMKKFKKHPDQKILDVGCGLGATAHYIQSHGWGTVTGFDIEKESIEYAMKHYPTVNFFVAEVESVDRYLDNSFFDIIYLFNSFFAFNNQKKALLALNKIAKKTSTLVIFDYAIKSLEANHPFYRIDGSVNQTLFRPVILDQCQTLFNASGWQLKEMQDITNKYVEWYHQLFEKLKQKKSQLINKFGHETYAQAYQSYENIYNGLKKNKLGGVILYAESD